MSIIKASGAGESGTTNFYNEQVTTSLRFPNDNRTMTRAYGTGATSNTTMSFGGWYKLSRGAYASTFSATLGGSGVPQAYFAIDTGEKLLLRSYTGSADVFNYVTTQVFRDQSAWYHFWFQIDTTDSTASDRVKIYVNGVRVTDFSTETNPSSSATVVGFNQNYTHYFGHSTGTYGIQGYLADWWFLDGQDVSPVDTVGEFKDGIFIPKEYSSPTFGNKGWHLEFKQTGTSANSSGIGADTSGNGNHWTVSSEFGAEDSAFVDSPENNFCIASSDFRRAYRTQKQTGLEGNLKFEAPGTYNSIVQASMSINEIASQGGVYFEARVLSGGAGNNSYIGVVSVQDDLTSDTGPNTWPIKAVYDYLRGYFYKDASASDNYSSNSAAIWTTNDVIGIAIKSDGKFFMHKNGTYFNQLSSGAQQNPSTGANELVTLDLTNYEYVPFIDGESAIFFNFGQDSTFGGAISAGGNTDANSIGDFKYAVPTGFLALCNSNLPKLSIGPNSTTQSVNHFGTLAYTGDGSQTRTITSGATGISGEIDFQPDWIAHKIRSGTAQGTLNFDSVRGFAGAHGLDWSANTAPGTVVGANSAEYGFISGVGTNSFDVNDGTAVTNGGYVNYSGRTYVAWNWKAGGSSVTNNDGSISSTVSANTTAGFSIVKATSPSSGTWTVGHGLGATPDFIIQKYLASSSRWTVWHNLLTSGQYLGLNETNAIASSGTPFNFTFNSTVIGGNADYDATSTDAIYYVFREVAGFSKFGQYTGNGATDGTFIQLGFRPAWFMVKAQTGTNNWVISDSVRSPTNVTGNWLYADGDFVEDTGSSRYLDFLSNGVKLRNSGTGTNNNGTKYLYFAFAENPFKFSLAR